MLAAGLLDAVCRLTLVAEGIGVPLCAVCGPLLVGTSATVVTTFATAVFALREEATGDGEDVVIGNSAGEFDSEVARRVALELVAALGLVAATCDGTGSAAADDACGATVAWRRVAVLVSASSVAEEGEVLGAVAAGSTLEAAGMLGAPVFRVRVAMAAGFACADGFSLAWARAIREAGWSV